MLVDNARNGNTQAGYEQDAGSCRPSDEEVSLHRMRSRRALLRRNTEEKFLVGIVGRCILSARGVGAVGKGLYNVHDRG